MEAPSFVKELRGGQTVSVEAIPVGPDEEGLAHPSNRGPTTTAATMRAFSVRAAVPQCGAFRGASFPSKRWLINDLSAPPWASKVFSDFFIPLLLL